MNFEILKVSRLQLRETEPRLSFPFHQQLTKLIFKDQEINTQNERIALLEKKIYEKDTEKVN